MPIDLEAQQWVKATFEESIVPTLVEYIAIPCKSPMFEPDWRSLGHIDRATKLFADWAEARLPTGATLEVLRLGERTPVIFIDIPATNPNVNESVLLYGHLDKQPEMTGWKPGLGPWSPVLEGDKLYGRGAADDGYALFASLTAINALRRQGVPCARCVILIEACEESGSYDLPAYVEHLLPRLQGLSLVICLDSGCANYDQLWCTTSLRGVVMGNLEVSLLTEGVHSGDGTGVVASSFRVARQLLDRLEDSHTGAIRLEQFSTAIPAQRRVQAECAAEVLGEVVWNKFPLQLGVGPLVRDNVELILNRTWRAGLAVTAAEGLPSIGNAGNVLRPVTELKLSMRIPPRVNPQQAAEALVRCLEADPPYGAKVSFGKVVSSAGWDAPELAPWLEHALGSASTRHFGKPAMYMGEGGTIPFMHILGEKFPAAQFCITGVLGPSSNAHGPNECLHLPTALRLTLCIADVVEAHAKR